MVSLNQLDAMSEYDQYVLQGNSTKTSLSIPWTFSRRLVPLQVGGLYAFVSGKLEFELRPRRLIKLKEFLDLLDRCNVAFQDSTPISSSFSKLNLKIIGAMKRVAHHTARELWMMDDNQYTSFQVSGKVPKPPTAGELAMDL